jgi:hypothetical protein
MEQIKNYFSAWDLSRIIRMSLSVALLFGYFSSKETIFIFASAVLGLQAIFNISCPGGACETPKSSKTEEPIIKVKKYEPEK